MMGTDYYKEHLAAEKLKRVYEIAPPRVKQYLRAEIDFVLSHIKSSDILLELGCGYGRVLGSLANRAGIVWGIDNSMASLKLAADECVKNNNIFLAGMEASQLGFRDGCFDVVVCIQNGISAFHVDPVLLFSEAVRVAKPGDRVFFSSYSDKFWPRRMEWFEIQSKHGLLGEIDYKQTEDGIIVTKDGFTARTFREADFIKIAGQLHLDISLTEVDDSSLFCVIEA